MNIASEPFLHVQNNKAMIIGQPQPLKRLLRHTFLSESASASNNIQRQLLLEQQELQFIM